MPFRDKSERNKWINERRRAFKERAVGLRGGCCQQCGYVGPALGWHHRDSMQKEGNLSAHTWGWERYWHEVQKCNLLCANCHIEEHNPA